MIGSGGALLVMGALVPLNRRLMAAGEKVARIPDEPADPGPDLQGSNVSQPG